MEPVSPELTALPIAAIRTGREGAGCSGSGSSGSGSSGGEVVEVSGQNTALTRRGLLVVLFS
jgi:hypothetical protein